MSLHSRAGQGPSKLNGRLGTRFEIASRAARRDRGVCACVRESRRVGRYSRADTEAEVEIEDAHGENWDDLDDGGDDGMRWILDWDCCVHMLVLDLWSVTQGLYYILVLLLVQELDFVPWRVLWYEREERERAGAEHELGMLWCCTGCSGELALSVHSYPFTNPFIHPFIHSIVSSCGCAVRLHSLPHPQHCSARASYLLPTTLTALCYLPGLLASFTSGVASGSLTHPLTCTCLLLPLFFYNKSYSCLPMRS
ncbi:hypothetical protein EDC01DRAFT_268192 [Geopyxis carbonaria]|nr:hypothetical protein EDC01DRAFT_268192 [Geopyxis carbonaria]